MGAIHFFFGFGFCLLIQSNAGQLLKGEELRNETTCLPALNISCSHSEITAVYSLYFFYDSDCYNMCCSYNSSHTSIGAEESDIQEIRRICSGRESCSSRFDGVRDFGSFGLQPPSYVMAHYYCIAGSRVNTVCSNKEVMSQGRQPLYLTNKNYPSVTTENSTCSCSLEINSCSSDIQLNVLDLDLYLDTVTCEQSLEFINNKDNELKRINCESYHNNSITSITLNSHYTRINFIDNSTQDQEGSKDQEGYFLLGFKATDEHVTFSISCPYKQELICLDCEDTFSISNGYVRARDNNAGNGSLADVNCDTGYETVKPYVRCLETGHWENASCSRKDCGSLPKIPDVEYNLVDVSNTTYGAVATVSCSEGYESKTQSITCLESGQWTSALCTAKDCGGTPSIDNGKISSNATFFEAVATVTCDTGYSASVNRIKCLSSGKWETATCTIEDCGNPPVIKNGEIVLLEAGKTTYNSSAKVTCKEGYNAMKQVVKCDKTDCGSPSRLDYGNISLASVNMTSVGATAEVLCDIGHDASALSIKCLRSGQWETVRCTLIDCGKPPSIDYGSVTLLKASSTTYSSSASVTCQEGYTTSKQIIVCRETGSWESSSCDSEGDEKRSLIVLVSILSTLLLVVMILFASLYVFWRNRKRQRKRKSSQEVNTYEEVIRHGEQHQYSDIAMETQQ